ncbi:glycosyltransferase [Corynebacterium sp. 3HC-13]|uniref:glycosyltransferase n=1 Tax=Corynebacterium poyangense TaxID=2684405 RepID=UPI001CCB4AF2|nr:glycosyltransferase [Corynebacterium poyangense]MBZ8177037.1 glycosyltransferase [Corynebacterium poyangense]
MANAFPYGTWEPYLATELRYLVRKYDIYIYSLMLRKEQLRTCRTIDPGIKVGKIFQRHPAVYFLWIIRVLLDVHFYEEVIYLSHAGNLNMTTVKNLCKFLSRAHYEKHQILKDVKKSWHPTIDEELVIYAYRSEYQPYVARMVANKFPNNNIKVISRAHSKDLYEYRNPKNYLPCRKLTFQSVDRVYCVSDHGYQYLTNRFSKHKNKFVVSRLGVNRSGYNNSRSRSKNSQLKIATCSALIPEKRIVLLVQALKLIKNIDIDCTIFGSGPEARNIIAEVALLGKNINVHVMGNTAWEKIMKWYSSESCDLLVNVSTIEGVPVSIMEALSFGVPVMATAVGGNVEIVNDDNGILLPANPGPSLIADALEKFASLNHKGKDSYRRNALNSWEKNWNAEVNYSKFILNIEELFVQSPGISV